MERQDREAEADRRASNPSPTRTMLGALDTDTPELVRQTIVAVLSERIRLLGVDRSGAYEHYNLVLAQGFPIGQGELSILDFVRERTPNLRSYHEIGSAFGTLPFMLACEGFAAVGVERDERRYLTALAIQQDLVKRATQVETNCRLIGGSFPDAVSDLDVAGSMAILTDFVATQSPREYIRVCQGLARYRYVVMDLQRFCSKRGSRDEQERLIQELARYGLEFAEEIFDLDSQGRFVLFESKIASEKRPVPDGKSSTATSPSSLTSPASDIQDASDSRLAVAVASAELAELETPRLQPLIQSESAAPAIPLRGSVLPAMPSRARSKRFGGWLGLSALLVIGVPSVLAVLYYGFFASRQYLTSFQFAVRGPSQAAIARGGGGSTMTNAGAMSPDSFVVTDYINSAQAVADVQRQLDIKAIFSGSDVDFWARLPEGVTVEDMAKYWQRMVSASFDLISGNITVTVRAFSPAGSLNLANALVAASDEMFRKLNAQLQQDYVRVADANVGQAQKQLMSATHAVLEFRNKSGLVDPAKTADAGASIIDDLRKQLATVQAQYSSLKATAANSPVLTALKSQMATLENQINRESRLGASQVKAVSAETLARYQTLELERQTAEKLYGEAVSLRTQAYLMAQSQQSYLGLFAVPSLPQSSLYPDRPRAIITIILSAAVAWFIGMLVVYALRDHLM